MVELNAKSLGEQMAEVLARDIMDGKLEAGARLGEEELAARFGTSRSPVRDALKILDREQFVSISPRRQVNVQPFDYQSIANIFLVRSRLYGLAAAQHAMSGSAEHHERLLHDGHQMLVAAQKDDQALFGEANSDFHNLLTSTCGNPMLENAISSIGAIAVAYLQARVRTVPGRLHDSALGHIAAAQAIMAREPSRAEPLMSSIITGAGRTVLLAEAPERTDLIAMLEHTLESIPQP